MSPMDIAAMNAALEAQNQSIDMRGRQRPAAPAMAYVTPGAIDPVTGETIEMFDGPVDFGGDYSSMPTYRPPADPESASAMSEILRRFETAGGTTFASNMAEAAWTGQPFDAVHSGLTRSAQTLAGDAEYMPELRRALKTSRTENGIRVGNWEITVMKEGAKRYDVSHCDTGDVIAKNLYLYEAAEALVKHLNEGHGINDARIQRILGLEVDYARNVENAVQYKHQINRAVDRCDNQKVQIAMARLSEAKAQAVKAKKLLGEFIER